MGFVKFFKGGVAAPHRKNTKDSRTVVMDIPDKVIVPMVQHIGAPCEPTVKKGDSVKVGQVIGDSKAFVSTPIHSSVSGTVVSVGPRLYASGMHVVSIEIETDKKQEVFEDVKPPKFGNQDEFVKAIRQSGLVGLGGAGFPTHIKLMAPKGKKIDTLVINGAECEPYITSDYREIIENPQSVIDGIKIVAEQMGIESVKIGIEDNKPEAIEILTKIAGEDSRIDVVKLRSRYPQGAEKMLIYAVTGRKVPPGKLPADVGCVVLNINSASFVSEFCKTGMPLIKKRVTVDGPVVVNPQNVEVLIGTLLEDVFTFCGGFTEEPRKVLMGGPMMGIAQYSLETSVIKNTNALIAMDKNVGDLPAETACMRCGRCVNACPMNLLPLDLNRIIMNEQYEEMDKYHVLDCIECGSCSYVCPAKRHLVQSIRLGKTIKKKQAARK